MFNNSKIHPDLFFPNKIHFSAPNDELDGNFTFCVNDKTSLTSSVRPLEEPSRGKLERALKNYK